VNKAGKLLTLASLMQGLRASDNSQENTSLMNGLKKAQTK
jgi:hypothetical protein